MAATAPFRLRWALLLVVALGGVLAAPASPGGAQTTFTVDAAHITGNAATDDPLPDGVCNANCSLREAVQAANAIPGVDTITFAAAGTVALGRTGAEDANASFNDLDVLEGLLVTGHAGGTTINTAALALGPETRALHANGTWALELRDLTIRGGRTSVVGGAVLMQGGSDLTLTRTMMADNQAGIGGAVVAVGGDVTIVDATFSTNVSALFGGAAWIDSSPAVSITGSTFTGNVSGMVCCGSANVAGAGGALALTNERSVPGAQATIADSTFTGNDAREGPNGGGVGGAIAAGTGVTISGSVVDDNGSTLTQYGGGIAIIDAGDGSSIVNSSITGNRALLGGGGVWVGPEGRLLIESTTVSGNTVSDPAGLGGGILAFDTAADLDLVNVTVSGNTSTVGGGGIHIAPEPPGPDPCPPKIGCRRADFAQNPLAASLHHVTVVGNEGDAGIDVTSTVATLSLRSTLVADNDTLNCGPQRISSAGFNLEDRDECPLTQASDLPSTPPGIGALADNGGAAQGANGTGVGFTHALTDTSAALDVADPAGCPNPVGVDERGQTRPSGGGCDIGAFELTGAGTVTITKDVAPGTIQPGATATFTIVVTNTSGATATDVVVTDVVPDGLTITHVAPTGTCSIAAQTMTCNLGDLAPAAQVTITLVINGSQPGNYLNTAVVTVDGTQADMDDASLVVATGEGCSGMGASGTGIPEGVVRVQGLNRIQTAVAASQAACGDGEAPAVVLTRADLFPDAQAGTPLAIALGAPLLLSDPATLSGEAEVELQRVLPQGGTVYLLGGTVALSDVVQARLQLIGYTTVRYGGVNRFETAAIIANQGLANPANLLVANGGDFADSIVAGAAAAAIGDSGMVEAAVLLTSGADIPPETQTYLDGRTGAPPTIITIGALAAQAFPAAESVAGPSRFETSVAVAQRFFDAVTIVGVARADDFADGLTGGALVGRPILGPGPILLTATDTLPDAITAYLQSQAGNVTRALIFGGTAAVSSNVEQQVGAALGLT